MRRPIPIGWRLSAFYAAVLSVALIFFGLGTWMAVRHSLRAALDQELALSIRGLTTVLRIESEKDHSRDRLSRELQVYAASAPEDDLLQVLDGDNFELLPSADVSGTMMPLVSTSPRVFADAAIQGRPYRLATEEVEIQGARYRVSVGMPREPMLRVEAQLLGFFAWLLPAVLLAASAAGLWMSRRALAPVAHIAATARDISIDRLDRRLEIPAGNDELRDLSLTINGMLDRLDLAVRALRQFTADASHELRTPITAIRAEAEVALSRERPAEDYRLSIARISEEAGQTSALVEDLLFLARADADQSASSGDLLELGALAEEVAAKFALVAGSRGQRLSAFAPDEELLINCRALSVRRLLIALVDNAVKFTPPGGSIETRVWREGTEAVLSVQDSGPGIPAGDLPQVFERFYRGDRSRNRSQGGHGLGLAIAQKIALNHRTRIQAANSDAGGACFEVRFPLTGAGPVAGNA